MEHVGRPLLADACQAYAGWGAYAKVRRMESEHTFLTAARSKPPRGATLGATQTSTSPLR